MHIIKREGNKVKFSPNKIFSRIKTASKNIISVNEEKIQSKILKVNCDAIFVDVIKGMVDGISTKEVDNLIANTAASFSADHYDYSLLASRIAISRLHKETESDFFKLTQTLFDKKLVSEEYYNKVNSLSEEDRKKIKKSISFLKDYNFDYFGLSRLTEIYLIKDKGVIYERPQMLYMRIAMHLNDDIDEIIGHYKDLRDHYISQATPTQINSGTPNGQLASCNLNLNTDDSRDGLLNTFQRVCISSSKAEGIGLAMHNQRSKYSPVGNGGGRAGGILKYAKILNEGMRFFDQTGKRPGSLALYLEPWHRDIFDVLDLKKNTGIDELRARDLFTALWIPDNFMRAVQNNEDYYLFCPYDIRKAGLPALHTVYGDEFEKIYNQAIELGLGYKVQAQKIWIKILESQIETGVPYMLYKDHANRKTNHQMYGTVSSSNLCSEIIEYTDELTTAICTLTSIPVQKFYKNGRFNWTKLASVTKRIVRVLNKAIDINKYSTKEGAKGGLEQRALGIGIQGLADLFAQMKVSFTSDKAREMNMKIFEYIYYYAIDQSCEIAKETGVTYHKHDESPMSKGTFQFDMWDDFDEKHLTLDWNSLKEKVKQYGLANSLFTTQMPTASSAAAMGSNEASEPFNSNISTRRVKGGEFIIINKHLVRDLEEIDLWNSDIKNKMISLNGSVQDIVEIPEDIRERYRTAYEIPQKDLMIMSKERGYFVDQSQSFNVFMNKPSANKLSSAHLFAWKIGLKTGMYYLRTKAISTGAKHLAGISNKQNTIQEQKQTIESDFECIGCGS